MPGHLLVFVCACARTRVCIGVKLLLARACCVCVRVQALVCICACAMVLVHVRVFVASCARVVTGVNAYAEFCLCARLRPNMPGHLLVFVSACARTRMCIGVKVLLARTRCVCVRVQALVCICTCALLLVHAHVFVASCTRVVTGVNAYAEFFVRAPSAKHAWAFTCLCVCLRAHARVHRCQSVTTTRALRMCARAGTCVHMRVRDGACSLCVFVASCGCIVM
jgi:hypothetical protein